MCHSNAHANPKITKPWLVSGRHLIMSKCAFVIIVETDRIMILDFGIVSLTLERVEDDRVVYAAWLVTRGGAWRVDVGTA